MQLFNYQKLIGIQVLHDFYTSLIASDFTWIPEQNTRRVLNSLGLKTKAKSSGIRIFAEVDASDKLVKEQQTTSVKLVLFMRLDNPLFVNFSDLPFDLDHSKIFYFSNKSSNKREVFDMGRDSLLLNQGDHVTAFDLMKVVGKVYSFVLPGDDGAKTANLVSLDSGDTLISREEASVDNRYNFNFQLDGLKAGRYKLEIDGLEKDRFYYADEFSLNRYFAVVEIFSDTDSDYAYFNPSDEITSKNYSIAFNRRSTFWRYKVVNRNSLDLSDPQIREEATPWDFTMAGGNVFTSNTPMPLKEAPITGIALKGDKNNNASVLIENLPNPDPGLIKPDPDNPTNVYSDIYIYL